MQLQEALAEKFAAQTALATLKAETERKIGELNAIIDRANQATVMKADGLDIDKIDLARTIISVSDYSRGGDDRASCVRDAIKQFATGKPINAYTDLWRVYFGTKTYDRWHGQREDHTYGMGPRHGSIIFQIQVTDAARKRAQSDLTVEEIDAVLYVLLNLERIQAAEKLATA